MEKEKKVPEIRFKGFSEEWEEKQLDKVAAYRNGKAHEKDISNEGSFIVVNSKFVSTNGNIIKYSNKNNEPLLKNEIAFVLSDVPNGRALARTFHIDKDNVYTLNQRIAGITPNEITNSYFLYILMNRNEYFLKYDDGAKQTNLSINDVLNFYSFYPKFNEQTQIGNYFSKLDNLITLTEQKLTKLRNVKKACLEKMFPKDGENIPEIRFKGFSEEWKENRLGKVTGIYDGVHQTPNYQDSGIMFLSVENITTLKSKKYISEEAFQKNYKIYPQKGDVLMTRIGDVGTPNVVKTLKKLAFYVSLALLKPYNINSYFLCNSILSPLFQCNLKERTLITAIPQKINKDEIGKVVLFIPSTKEQEKIGNYFSQLDNLITLTEQKLTKLRNIKKACLERMFV